jgi:hypothetical protein
MRTVMAVRRSEFQALVRPVPFLALPREEIARLHAAIDVSAVDQATLRTTTEWLPLQSFIVIHYNYSWLTFRGPDDVRTLLLPVERASDAPAPLFLGDELVEAACGQVERALGIQGGCDVRLAGLLQCTEIAPEVSAVGLVHVGRLAARGTFHGVDRCGNFELSQGRPEFDTLSQVVIGHLSAL